MRCKSHKPSPQKALLAFLLVITILTVSQSIPPVAQAAPTTVASVQTTISYAPAAPTGLTKISPDNNPFPAFKWNMVAGATSYEVQMDGGAWTDIGNKISYVQPTILTKGSHTFSVRSKDGTGTSSPASLGFSVSATIDLANTKIAYSSNKVSWDTYVMNADGSGEANLSIGNPNYPIRWFPDGSKLILSTGYMAKKYVFIANIVGSGKTALTGEIVEEISPSWSPDGSKIVFLSTRDSLNDKFDVYVTTGPGAPLTRLTDSAWHEWGPAWSPDGSKIAYVSSPDGNDNEIYVMNADGSGKTQLTNNTTYDDSGPAWSPDGTKIAFVSNRDGNYEIYVMDSDGSNQTKLTSNTASDDYLAWSPNGAKIAFISERDGKREVYVMNSDGSGQTRLTTHTNAEYATGWSAPSWSPDGNKITYSSRESGDWSIYAMNADGSGQAKLTPNGAFYQIPSWSPFLNLSPWSMQWGGHNTPASLAANQPASVSVTVTNRSTMTWPSGGANPVYLSYHWYNSLGQVAVWDGLRTALPNDLYSLQSATLTANLKAPSTPGNYTLKWDIVQEGINWFSFSGAATYDVPVTITTPVYNVQWGTHNTPTSLSGRQSATASVTVTNAGTFTWPSGGANPVYLSYHWYTGGSVYLWDGLRTPLPADLPPGQSVTLTASLKALDGPTPAVLKWDIVQEGVTWFSFNGAPTLDVSITISKPNYDVMWSTNNAPDTIDANQQVNVSAFIKNDGLLTWPSSGANPVYLSYHWYNALDQVVLWDGLRTPLTFNMAELDSATLTASLKAPPGGGNYTLKWDMVHEGVTWFSFTGDPMSSKAVTVNPVSYSVQWGSHNTPATLNASQSVSVSVAVTNAGSTTWPSSGATPAKLSYHWLNSLGQVVTWDGQRTSLTADLATGQSATLTASLIAPSSPGTYTLQWDIVREGVTWVGGTGSPVLQVSGITVQ